MRLDFAAGSIWIVAAIPQLPDPQRVVIPGDEIMVVFSARKMRDGEPLGLLPVILAAAAVTAIGSILGIGYPSWTGGVLQYVNQYDGGLPGFVARARVLAERYGERFDPPPTLVAMAERGERFE